ncbi:extracellular solute-binding protein [Mariluticola halotolerans]|uniref:extracellular solute-binding protein n=1 Tax=Mariluticola halotolerans TaxID=2909283 RepID=UPI0026E3632A|nr:extracellular solute-binding protein [Mariluticola halotolerans]UJQ94294.1 extracellular solute-binding protein [Mariluticola halotolerans]
MSIRKRTFLGLAGALIASTSLSGFAMAQEGSVVIYTAHKSSIVDTLLPIFEKETGLKADVVKLGSGDVAKRAQAEAANPAADVIWSISGSQLTELSDLLEPYTPPEFDQVDPQFIRDDSWTPYTAVVYVLAVNTDLLPIEDAPKTWADLADPKWDDKIASARADGSGSAMQQLTTVLTIGGDEGWDKYAAIAKNFVFTDSSGAVPRYVADGETWMGLTLEDNALEYVKGGAPMSIVHLSDGTAATPDGVALVKNGPNPEGGKAFIDWAMSKSTQETLAQEIGRRSVRLDVAGPAGTPNLSDLTLVNVKPLSEFGGAEAVLEKWRAAIGE